MEKTQPIQNSQYSSYRRGVATGALAAAGTLAAGAFAIHSYVHSGTPIPTSTLKEISVSLAGGISGLITAGAVSSIPASFIPDKIKTGQHSVVDAAIVIKAIAAISGGAASCITLTAARIIERLL